MADAAGQGDITVAAPIAWSTGAGLTLSAYRNVEVNAGVSSSGGGAVTLYADNTGTGVGTVGFASGATVATSGAVNVYYNPASNPAGSAINTTSYTSPTDYSALVSGGGTLSAYMLVNTLNDLQNMQNDLGGTYALGADINAGATVSWNGGQGFQPIGASVALPFTGFFEGQDHMISNLTINRGQDVVGLFGTVGRAGRIDDLALANVDVSGQFYVGALVGDNYGTLSNVRTSGTVTGAGGVGGLVGVSEGYTEINGASSSATVTGTGDDVGGLAGVDLNYVLNSTALGSVHGADNVGGLVGLETETISSAMASASVTGNMDVGGLVGDLVGNQFIYNPTGGHLINTYSLSSVNGVINVEGLVGETRGLIDDSYATGAVSGTQAVGGIAGLVEPNDPSAYNQPEPTGSNLYWDPATTGVSQPFGSVQYPATSGTTVAAVGRSSPLSAYAQASYTGFDFSAGGPWVIFEGATRPMLRSEASSTISNAHQLQLIDLNRAGSYTLANDIDLSVTGAPGDIWNPATGFVPIAAVAKAGVSSPFVGSLDGQGHILSNLTINDAVTGIGLFGVVGPAGRINNVNLSGAAVAGGYYTGALIGDNYGTISNVSVSGTVSGYGGTGGLVGVDEGGSAATSVLSSVSVAGSADDVGGLVGVNVGVLNGATATGSVTNTRLDFATGGLVGYNTGPINISGSLVSGSIIASTATGAVSGYSSTGGLVGDNMGTITTSSAAGTVVSNGEVTVDSGVGGLVGLNTGSITYSSASGSVRANSAQVDAGGLVGDNSGPISTSFATGSVIGNPTLISGYFFGYNGGLVGYAGAAETLTDVYATGAVSGGYADGGLIGANYGGNISQTYASGAVTGSKYVGGFIAVNTYNDIASSVWDVSTTGLNNAIGSGVSSSTTILPIGGSTNNSATQASSYHGFDFTNVWTINPGASRPYLIGNPQTPPPN